MEISSDVKRLMHHVLPGLVVLLEIAVLLAFDAPEALSEVGDASGALVVVGALFGTGAIGFALANIYHAIAWLPGVRRFAIVDYRDITGEPDFCDAWAVGQAQWVRAVAVVKDFDSIHRRVLTLSDVVHGLGACLVGAIVAPFFVYLVLLPPLAEEPTKLPGPAAVVTAVVWFVVLGWNHYRSRRQFEFIVRQNLSELTEAEATDDAS